MRASACIRTVEPAAQPVTVGQMRSHLRLSGHEEDALVAAAISAAVSLIEAETRRALITQTWRASIPGVWKENDPVFLPRPRLLEVSSVQFRNADGVWTAHTDYRLMDTSEPASIWLTACPTTVATPDNDLDTVWRVTYTAGYGPDHGSVPDSLCAAVKLLAAHLFENREATIIGTSAIVLPLGVERLIASFRVPWGGTNL